MIDLGSLNWLAIVVAGLVYFFLGALWYSPVLLGNIFIKYRGTIEDGGQPVEYLITLICDLAQAFVLAIFVRLAGAVTLEHGIAVGLAAAAGFAISNSFVFGMFSGVKRELWAIESGYAVVAYAIMGTLLALWR